MLAQKKNNPEPTSATRARAISEITSKPRKAIVRPAEGAAHGHRFFNTSLMSVPVALMAGMMPKIQAGKHGKKSAT